MKKLLLLLFSFSCFAHISFAQTVFAPPNSVWYTERIIDTDGGENYSLFETAKDTLFEGHICSKVVGREFFNTAPTSILETQYLYTHEDTVFYYNFAFNKFLPLYVFNVKKGDTISYHVPYIWISGAKTTFRVVVDSVDTVIIDGLKLRRIWTDGLDDFVLGKYVERLGAYGAKKLISPALIHVTPSSGGIRCYKDGEIDTNLHYKGWACDYLKSTNIYSHTLDFIPLVYPNPAREVLNIQGAESVSMIELYDVMGKLMKNEKVKMDNAVLDIKLLPAGAYHLKITTKEGNIGTAKVVKE